MDTLERKYETIQDERNTWMKKCEELEMQNRELQKRIRGLQYQIIDFDAIVSPSNLNIKSIEHLYNESHTLNLSHIRLFSDSRVRHTLDCKVRNAYAEKFLKQPKIYTN